jgi:hypothetical protein
MKFIAAFAAVLLLTAGHAHAATVHVPANTLVTIELAVPVSSKTHKSGSTFAFRLAEPLVVKGQILLRAGTPGVGDVIQSSGPGMGGKSGKLVLAARVLTPEHGKPVPLKGLQLSVVGKGQSNIANAAGIGGLAFAPLGVAALAIKGGDAVVPAGAKTNVKLAVAENLPSLGPAPKGVADSKVEHIDASAGPIALPAIPRGMGMIVFFRKNSILGTGQWFNVREEDKAIGKLTNGAWFTQQVAPGVHTYTAKTEPQFKDSLKLQVDAGETYFVEGVLTKGVVIGVADLTPSTRAAFNDAAKDLKPASAPDADKAEEKPAKPAG